MHSKISSVNSTLSIVQLTQLSDELTPIVLIQPFYCVLSLSVCGGLRGSDAGMQGMQGEPPVQAASNL